MMLLKAIRPIALDFLSTLVFIGLVALTGDIRLAIVAGMAAGLAEIAWGYARGHRAGLMKWMSLFIVGASGAASLITNDPRFVMLKPTLTYGVIGAVMMVPGWMAAYVPARARELVPRVRFVMWGYAWGGLMFASAIFNLVLIYGLQLDVLTWGTAMTIWGLGTKLSLFAIQYAMIRGEARRAALSHRGVVTPSPLSSVGPQ